MEDLKHLCYLSILVCCAAFVLAIGCAATPGKVEAHHSSNHVILDYPGAHGGTYHHVIVFFEKDGNKFAISEHGHLIQIKDQ